MNITLNKETYDSLMDHYFVHHHKDYDSLINYMKEAFIEEFNSSFLARIHLRRKAKTFQEAVHRSGGRGVEVSMDWCDLVENQNLQHTLICLYVKQWTETQLTMEEFQFLNYGELL